MDYLKKIKDILESDAEIISDEEIIDNRMYLIKHYIDKIKNIDDNFYMELIKLISNHLNELCDKFTYYKKTYDKSCNLINTNYNIDNEIRYSLDSENKNFAKILFNYVCNILTNNKFIKLDKNNLKNLLNRRPKYSDLDLCHYRPFDFEYLINIINENKLLEKASINTDLLYQILLDTYQINNEYAFVNLISHEEFTKNKNKLNEILLCVKPEIFIDIYNIIKNNYDKEYDVFNIIKKRNKNNFCEKVIIELLNRYISKEDCNLIHKILTYPEITINYNYYIASYYGETNLKSLIALRRKSILVNDLLSKEKNIQNSYFEGENVIHLFSLYAIIGNYDKALNAFKEIYEPKVDYLYSEDNIVSIYPYIDSFTELIHAILDSFDEFNIEYEKRKDIIREVLQLENIGFMKLEEILSILKKVLSQEDYKLIINDLISRKNENNLKFIKVNDVIGGTFELANDEEVNTYLTNELNKDNKKLTLNK